MTDVAPALYEAIKKSFDRRVKRDLRVQTIRIKIDKGTATAEDAFRYAGYLGNHASDALIECVTEDALPDGKMYWNISERTVKPFLLEVHEMVIDVAVAVQQIEDLKQKIGLKPVRPEAPIDRVEALMNKLAWATGAMEGT